MKPWVKLPAVCTVVAPAPECTGLLPGMKMDIIDIRAHSATHVKVTISSTRWKRLNREFDAKAFAIKKDNGKIVLMTAEQCGLWERQPVAFYCNPDVFPNWFVLSTPAQQELAEQFLASDEKSYRAYLEKLQFAIGNELRIDDFDLETIEK